MFNDIPYYKVNREERHFGFLFMAAILCSPSAREKIFEYINAVNGSKLLSDKFDIYAEVSIFRDYWNNLGDPGIYDKGTHDKRYEIFANFLKTMNIDSKVIESEEVFWTGLPGKSKLFYPGKWTRDKIDKAERNLGLKKREIWRLRWLCNAKPDILIENDNEMIFIEVKVESGFGHGYEGYSQEETQKDIINVGKNTIPNMMKKKIYLTALTYGSNGLHWDRIVKIICNSNDDNLSMIKRHLENIPRIEIAQQGDAPEPASPAR